MPFGAGGVTDTTARVFAEGLTRELGQPVVVENRRRGRLHCRQRGRQGQSRRLYAAGDHQWHVRRQPLIYKTLPYDPNKDFAYIAMLANTPTVLV